MACPELRVLWVIHFMGLLVILELQVSQVQLGTRALISFHQFLVQLQLLERSLVDSPEVL